MKNELKAKKTTQKKVKLFTREKNIFKYWLLWFKSLFYREDIFHATGSHIITAYPGGGKTLKMNNIINQVDSEKYFFLSNIKEFDGVKTFDLTEMFKDNTQVKKFPATDERGRKIYGVIFDEINLNFNKRLNRKSDYNDVFIGLVEFLVTHRHQGVPRVYFIGQKLELQDTQLQSLFKYWHDIVVKKSRYKYWYYFKHTFLKIPIKLKIDNFVKENNDDYLYLGRTKTKIKELDLTTYNTKALADNYKDLPVVGLKK